MECLQTVNQRFPHSKFTSAFVDFKIITDTHPKALRPIILGYGNERQCRIAPPQLVARRNKDVVAIEHNLRFSGRADWVIDMGPGAGSAGGKVLFEGTPLALMRRNDTPTARAMNAYFGFFKDAAV
ncbi:hypothetical protein [Bifidobacterium choladohabitans]|uniref:hypothetical protein n=1 Tax=Bifidobacterium choladohabitans TaxID=2750947 RepID=UPI0018DC07F3|nr:hypothetical protein [Bifidobacterium choladohabitans]